MNMHYRIVQIAKPYAAYLSYGGHLTTIPCYIVGPDKFETPELARKELKNKVQDVNLYNLRPGVSAPEVCLEDWFIVIQCF